MRKQLTLNSFTARSRFPSLLIICLCLTFLASCEREKVTIIYGRVTDQNKQPVDSILVIVDGVQFTKYTYLGEALTDSNGEYHLTITSKKFRVVNVIIPAWPLQNPKFLRDYKGFYAIKDDAKTSNCCSATVGKKTKYDFELTSK